MVFAFVVIYFVYDTFCSTILLIITPLVYIRKCNGLHNP
jgi:hypothetical protein